MPVARRMTPNRVIGISGAHNRNPNASARMTPTFERADPGSSKNAQPMTSPAPTAKGIPPESLVQIGTMMAACMAPNNATPSRPVTAPAIRNAVSLLDGRSALIVVMAPSYDRPNDALGGWHNIATRSPHVRHTPRVSHEKS